MAIYDPSLFLTATDRRLLKLLGQLILETEGVFVDSNCQKDRISLSNQEAGELLELLEQFVDSKRFQETAYLLESIYSGSGYDSNRLRNIYLSWRKFHGKSRALATDQWEVLLSRLGLAPRHYRGQPWYRTQAMPMSLDHFMKMERKLANSSGLSPRVQDLLLSYVRLQFGYVEAVRNGRARIERGQISSKPNSIIDTLRNEMKSKIGIKPIQTTKIAGVMVIVMDLTAAYFTRDWSVASFISTIAGAAPPVFLD